MFPFQAVIIIKTLRINQRCAAFTVLSKNFFPMLALDLIAKFREFRARE